MIRLRLLAAALFACLLIPGPSHAAPPVARLGDAIRLSEAFRWLGGGSTVPAAWAGVWQNEDSTYTGCDVLVPNGTDSSVDTLCTGNSVEPDTTGVGAYECTGTITDTGIDLTCTGTAGDTCVVTFTYHIVGTRTANSSYTVLDFRISYDPPASCFFIPDQCTRIVTRSTRIGPEPPSCSTPARRTTWGQLKTIYR